MNKITASLLLVVSLLAGCAVARGRGNWNDSQSIERQITIKRDDFKKLVEFTGPNCLTALGGTSFTGLNCLDEGLLAGSKWAYSKLFMRAWKADGAAVVQYQIYALHEYSGGWRFYDSAWDSNGNKLNTLVIDRDVVNCRNGCSYAEHVGVNVTGEYLEKNKDSGVRFKLSGKAGEQIFFIPPAYIRAFLNVAK